MVNDRIVAKGSSISKSNLDALYAIRKIISDRQDFIEKLYTIVEINDLYKNKN